MQEVPDAAMVEIDANHLTINKHADTANAIRAFLAAS
jgi:hypothetical protein